MQGYSTDKYIRSETRQMVCGLSSITKCIHKYIDIYIQRYLSVLIVSMWKKRTRETDRINERKKANFINRFMSKNPSRKKKKRRRRELNGKQKASALFSPASSDRSSSFQSGEQLLVMAHLCMSRQSEFFLSFAQYLHEQQMLVQCFLSLSFLFSSSSCSRFFSPLFFHPLKTILRLILIRTYSLHDFTHRR